MINYRKLISRFIFWLAILLVSVVALLVLTIEFLPFASSYTQRHRDFIEGWARGVLEQPIQISRVDITREGITPTIQFKDVTVFNDANTTVLAKIPEMRIGIDVIKSIVNLRIVPNVLYISGAHLAFYRSPNGDISLIAPGTTLPGSEGAKKKSISLNDIYEWLFTQKEIYLKDLVIDWQSSGSSMNCKLTSLYLYPGPEMEQAKAAAKKLGAMQKIPANLSFKIELPKGALEFNSSDKSKKLSDWLNQAFVAETEVSGAISLYGALEKRSDDPKDKFLLALRLHNANLNYYPKWPAIENLDADLLFDANSLHIIADAGEIGGAPFKHVDVKIPDFNHPVLEIKSKFSTSMERGFAFIEKSPLKDTFQGNLKNLVLAGPLNLDLDLNIPLTGEEGVKVIGKILLQNNSLHVSKWNFELENLMGNVFFTMDDLNAPALNGVLFGQKTNLDIKTIYSENKKRVTEVNIVSAIDSKMLTEDLLKQAEGSFAKNIQGLIEYNAKLEIPNGPGELNTLHFTSNLQGVNIDLPLPLKKVANEKIPLELLYKFRESTSDRLNIVYGNDVSAKILFNAPKESQLGPKGLSMVINVSKLNWSDWYDYFRNSSDTDDFKIQSLSETLSPAIRQITLNAAEFTMMGQTLRPAKIDIKLMPELKNLSLRIDSSNIKGNLYIMYSQIQTFIKGQFSKLFLEATGKDLTNLNPKDIPALSISSNNFHYNNKNYGRIVLETSPFSQGLMVNNVSVQSPFFSLKATGRWLKKNEQQQTTLQGQLDTKNLGNLLKQWSMGENVEHGEGSVGFSLNWQKSFFSPDINTMVGSMHLKFNSGQIVHLGKAAEAGLGVGRLFSLLSLQSLPRRLSLDFSDLATKGFSFDELHGTLKLDNGNIYTEDTHLEGVVAHVYAKGRIGLAAKDYDLILTTIPHVTSSLPVIATIVGGPIAGAATWLADKILTSPVKSVTAITYMITGPWAKPNIIKISAAKGRIKHAR